MAADRDRVALPERAPGVGDAPFVRRALCVLVLVGLAWVLIELSGLLLLIFGAVLVAIVFDALAEPIARLTRLPHRWALLLAILVVFTVLALGGWLFGARVNSQFAELQQTLPRAWRALETWLGETALGDRLLEEARGWSLSGTGLLRNVGSAAVATVGALGGLLLVVVAGIYLAAQPRMYHAGLLQLIPARSREAARETAVAVGRALRAWLGAQVIAMVAVGALTSLGLWAIGLPSVLALGMLAALAEFVPIIGPIIAAIPSLLIALTLGVDTVLWTLGLYIFIQQVEGNVIMPMVTRRAVALPPALALFSVVALGLLFGPLGVMLGAPLAIVLFVLVREVYVKRVLGEAAPPVGNGSR